ncbi:MAG: hypothetical protein HOP28_01380 [Gemmatimonadales bacterium]|nr:hypothetical protein [Gemmatimonadales bacterium]
MRTSMRSAALAAGTVLSALLFVTCRGGGTDSSGEGAEIDLVAVETGVDQIAGIINVCRPGGSLRAAPVVDPGAQATAALISRLVSTYRNGNLRVGGPPRSLGPTKPADSFGECGGRITYPSYSHSNGVTTATLEFDNYCEVSDDAGGNRIISDGTISFVNTGIPSASGPYTDRVEADSPGGVTYDTKTSNGASTISSQRISFRDYLLDAGVPGAVPTAANPNRIGWAEASVTDLVGGKTYRQTDVSVTEHFTPNGSELVTISGRGYRSNGDYYDIRTTSPITNDANGNVVGGVLTFTGGSGTQAVMTFLPGATFQATMTVNGQPVMNVPACR